MRQLAWQLDSLAINYTDPVPSTIAEEVTVESTTDPATAESATDCTDVQNKVSFRLVFVAVSKRSVMFVFSMEPLSQIILKC